MNIFWGITGTLVISFVIDRMMREFAKEIARSHMEAKDCAPFTRSADAAWESKIRKVA